jgi:hypothetical protein
MYELGDCQPTLSVKMPYGGVERCLLKHLAIRADSIIHGRSLRHSVKLRRDASLICSGRWAASGTSPRLNEAILAYRKAKATEDLPDSDVTLLSQ